MSAFQNSYKDSKLADAYSKLEFPGTYYLAFRDLPNIISQYAKGKKAVDFGCGTGRSTRFLKNLGFDTVGLDISEDMIEKAKALDPNGDYRLIRGEGVADLHTDSFDVVLSTFTFDNIPSKETKINTLIDLSRLLKKDGVIVNLVSAPEMYTHEWASFSTKDFPENKHAQSGEKVKVIITAIDDKRPVEDIIWSNESYRQVFIESNLRIINVFKPLATGKEPIEWVQETKIAPWTIYMLGKIC
jgi:ubiquinone/menaquinone biosynthesis C-methylase UbiE